MNGTAGGASSIRHRSISSQGHAAGGTTGAPAPQGPLERRDSYRQAVEPPLGGGGVNEELACALRSLENTLNDHIGVLRRGSERAAAQGGMAGGGPAGGAAAGASNPSAPRFARRQTSKLNTGGLGEGEVDVVRPDKVTISLRIVFLKVGEIDTLRDRYAADVLVQAKWREPAMDGVLALREEEINWDKYWNPRLCVENIYSEAKESVYYSVTFNDAGHATVVEKRRISGSFFEYMELNQFPFDTQDLTVTMSTERSESEVQLIEDVFERCGINGQSFVDEQEWNLHTYIHTWRKTISESFQNDQKVRPAFSAACKASRRPGFFVWNILVVMFLICSMSFGTFAVLPSLPQNRLQLSFFLLLTTISFKFVANQSLPMISYLTYLDKYILGSMCILCCICVWHAIIPVLLASLPASSAQTADMVALIVLGGIYAAFHIAFVLVITSMTKWKSRQMDNFSEQLNQGRAQSDTELNASNGNLLNGFESSRQVDARGQRNMVELATNQTVLTAWQ